MSISICRYLFRVQRYCNLTFPYGVKLVILDFLNAHLEKVCSFQRKIGGNILIKSVNLIFISSECKYIEIYRLSCCAMLR